MNCDAFIIILLLVLSAALATFRRYKVGNIYYVYDVLDVLDVYGTWTLQFLRWCLRLRDFGPIRNGYNGMARQQLGRFWIPAIYFLYI